MLVLSRHTDQSIVIDHPAGPIRVMIVEARAGKTRLGVTAPRSVAVHREEIWEEIQRLKVQGRGHE